MFYKVKGTIGVSILSGMLALPGVCFAHASFVPKDNLDGFSARDYEEGKTAYLKINIPHGCSSSDGSRTFSTRNVVMTMPNGVDLSGLAYTQSHGGEIYNANAVMGVKPAADGSWRKIKNPKGPVADYYSHGLRSEGVRSLQWLRGNIPADFYKVLEFRAGLPILDACISRLDIYFPTVQYCDQRTMKAWMRAPVGNLPADVVSTGYAPKITVVRNEEKNPLPAECPLEGEAAEVYPSEADIEASLLRRYY